VTTKRQILRTVHLVTISQQVDRHIITFVNMHYTHQAQLVLISETISGYIIVISMLPAI